MMRTNIEGIDNIEFGKLEQTVKELNNRVKELIKENNDLKERFETLQKTVARIDNSQQGADQRLKKLEEFSSTYPIYINPTPKQDQEFDKIKDEIWQNIKKEIDKEEKLDNHYQIGDRFKYSGFHVFDVTYVLASIDDSQAVLINLNTGGNWKSPVDIKTPGIVDKHEALEIGIQDMKKKI